MRLRTYTAILAIIAAAGGSCSKNFVTTSPEGNLTGNNFFLSTNDFKLAVVGAYTPLRDAAGYAFFVEEMRSDNTKYYYNAIDRGGNGYEQIADFNENSSNGVPGNVWIADFKGIQRTNVILDRLQNIKFAMTDADKNQIIGEAKALRAHYYFELVRLFGKLPLYLHEVTDSKTAIVDHRSSLDSVYAQIVSDFTDALSKLPNPVFASSPTGPFQTSAGRVNKGMVATELACVYLTRKDYASAIPLLQSVTQMGYILVNNYADNFDPKKKNGLESIFEVQYKSGTDGQQSSFIYSMIPPTNDATNILGKKYKITTGGGWNIPTADLVSEYESGDTRLDASIAVIQGKLGSLGDFQPDSVTSILNPTVPGKVTVNLAKKYYHLPYGLQNNTDDDWPWYRYSDVLLMLAECLNEQGKTPDAAVWLNKVRARANLGPTAATDQTGMRDAIYHERRVELAFENHRWFDLVRTGKAIDVMTAFGKKQIQNYPYTDPASYKVTQSRLIYAIPFRETQVNPLFGQNDGY